MELGLLCVCWWGVTKEAQFSLPWILFFLGLRALNPNAITHRLCEAHFYPIFSQALNRKLAEMAVQPPVRAYFLVPISDLASREQWSRDFLPDSVTQDQSKSFPSLQKVFPVSHREFQNGGRAVMTVCLPVFRVLNGSIFLPYPTPTPTWFISWVCSYISRSRAGASDLMESMPGSPHTFCRIWDSWPLGGVPWKGVSVFCHWEERNHCEAIREWIVVETMLWVQWIPSLHPLSRNLGKLRSWLIVQLGCSQMTGFWLTGWGHKC